MPTLKEGNPCQKNMTQKRKKVKGSHVHEKKIKQRVIQKGVLYHHPSIHTRAHLDLECMICFSMNPLMHPISFMSDGRRKVRLVSSTILMNNYRPYQLVKKMSHHVLSTHPQPQACLLICPGEFSLVLKHPWFWRINLPGGMGNFSAGASTFVGVVP